MPQRAPSPPHKQQKVGDQNEAPDDDADLGEEHKDQTLPQAPPLSTSHAPVADAVDDGSSSSAGPAFGFSEAFSSAAVQHATHDSTTSSGDALGDTSSGKQEASSSDGYAYSQDSAGWYYRQKDGATEYWDPSENGWKPLAAQSSAWAPAEEPEEADEPEPPRTIRTSADSPETCNALLAEFGLTKAKPRQVPTMIETYGDAFGKEKSLALVEAWNKVHPESAIPLEAVGLSLDKVAKEKAIRADEEAKDAILKAQEDAEEEKEKTSQAVYNGKPYALTLLGKGGYHKVYAPTGDTPMVPSKSNDEVLVRVPFAADAPSVRNGIRSGDAWGASGFTPPAIYNRGTAERDGFYVVERVPNAYDKTNPMHVGKVATLLGTMAHAGDGPDFRPDNVRFRANGDLVLIDFSENPGITGAKSTPTAFLREMNTFVGEFAGGDPTARQALLGQMPSSFVSQMEVAGHSYDS
jgi:hypothetical protein